LITCLHVNNVNNGYATLPPSPPLVAAGAALLGAGGAAGAESPAEAGAGGLSALLDDSVEPDVAAGFPRLSVR
jgi:hypothetical protein